MAKITKIQAQKKKGRVNIFLDDSFSLAVYDAALVDFNLYKGKELTDAQITILKNQDDEAKCLTKAYHLLSFRPRSEAELKKRLAEKYSKELVTKVIKKLMKNNYVDDAAFVDFWIENRARSRGAALLRSELIKNGISKATIDEKLSTLSDEMSLSNALSLIKSKTKYRSLNKNEGYQKISAYLMRRGFSYDIIKKVLKELYG